MHETPDSESTLHKFTLFTFFFPFYVPYQYYFFLQYILPYTTLNFYSIFFLYFYFSLSVPRATSPGCFFVQFGVIASTCLMYMYQRISHYHPISLTCITYFSHRKLLQFFTRFILLFYLIFFSFSIFFSQYFLYIFFLLFRHFSNSCEFFCYYTFIILKLIPIYKVVTRASNYCV